MDKNKKTLAILVGCGFALIGGLAAGADMFFGVDLGIFKTVITIVCVTGAGFFAGLIASGKPKSK